MFDNKKKFIKKSDFIKDKDNNNLSLVGRKAILEVLENPVLKNKVISIALSSSQKNLIEICEKNKIPIKIENKGWFERKFHDLNHQYACVFLKAKAEISLKQLIQKFENQNKAFFLILDQIQDPHNFGAIIRTAVAAGVDAIIIGDKNQVKLNSTVLKVSVGTGLLIDIVTVSNLNYALKELKEANYWSYASVLNEHAKIYNEIDYANKTVLIMGNEGDGISPLLIKNSDFQTYIPISNKVDSLNVSVATAIFIYEIIKRK